MFFSTGSEIKDVAFKALQEGNELTYKSTKKMIMQSITDSESQVLGWIQTSVSSSATGYWDHISERINKAIETDKNIRIAVDSNDLPWAPTSGSNQTPPLPV